MRLVYENFGLASMLRVADDHGNPIKILLNGGDGGVVGITAAGHIIHVPPDSPVKEDQAIVAYMRTLKSTILPGGNSPVLTPCDVINSEIAALELRRLQIAKAGGDSCALDSQLEKLEAKATLEHCPPVRINVKP